MAIHTNGGKTFNFGTRITPQYLDYIKYWIGTSVAHTYNKKVVITKKKYDLWNSFYFDSKKGKSDAYVNKPVIAKYIYTLGNGRQYYSLYSIKSDKWLGYVNVNATK